MIDTLTGNTVLEFGTDWCGYCQRAQPLIEAALARHARMAARHLKIEDGRGRALGRSFTVRLWPTLIFLRDGAEVARVVRPANMAELDDAFATLEQAA
jgi:thioredoxin 1